MIDTIAALATAKGKAAIGVVKVSGPAARAIGIAMTGEALQPRVARYLGFCDADGEVLDRGIAVFFAAPDSYTGEDVLELQAHGNPFVLDQILNSTLQNGARQARPGEFTERAFLNDKLDLAQAEAVADLIESNSAEAARAAVRSLSGVFSKQVKTIAKTLVDLRVYIEAALDFAEEEIDFLRDDSLTAKLTQLDHQIDDTLQRASNGSALREGLTVVIVGEPNVGKSSLLNSLTQQNTAIVTDIAGTTRDVLRENIIIDGLPIRLVDTAGLRDTDDKVEREGVRRAREQMQHADLILAIGTAGHETIAALRKIELPDVDILKVFNKADLVPHTEHADGLTVSAKTGFGIDTLREEIKRRAGVGQSTEGSFMARRRHLNALQLVRSHVQLASAHLLQTTSGELAAEELRAAQQQLNLITGEFSADDLLGEIFGRFCIGK